MINVNVTNELARVAGLIANKHPDRSIQIEWREGMPEQEWYITASDGRQDTVYIVDDESGSWAPMTEAELALRDSGESIFKEQLAT